MQVQVELISPPSTVNTQLVNGTLMNIADNPTDVQLPGAETQPMSGSPLLL